MKVNKAKSQVGAAFLSEMTQMKNHRRSKSIQTLDSTIKKEANEELNRYVSTQLMKKFYDNSVHGLGSELKIQECF